MTAPYRWLLATLCSVSLGTPNVSHAQDRGDAPAALLPTTTSSEALQWQACQSEQRRVRVPVSGDTRITPPQRTVNVAPVNPNRVAGGGTRHVVVMQVLVSDQGEVVCTRVDGELSVEFDAAARAAVRQWRYRPALMGTQPLPAVMNVTITFPPF